MATTMGMDTSGSRVSVTGADKTPPMSKATSGAHGASMVVSGGKGGMMLEDYGKGGGHASPFAGEHGGFGPKGPRPKAL